MEKREVVFRARSLCPACPQERGRNVLHQGPPLWGAQKNPMAKAQLGTEQSSQITSLHPSYFFFNLLFFICFSWAEMLSAHNHLPWMYECFSLTLGFASSECGCWVLFLSFSISPSTSVLSQLLLFFKIFWHFPVARARTVICVSCKSLVTHPSLEAWDSCPQPHQAGPNHL